MKRKKVVSPQGHSLSRNIGICLAALIISILAFSAPVHGIILFGSGDPEQNTSAPTGSLAGSGWQYQGNWGVCLGTAIAPNYFITAKHLGGSIGQAFEFAGGSYITTAYFDSSSSDLRIWRVCGRMPQFASLYTGSYETGHGLVVFGRGTQRAEAVYGPGFLATELKGWKWGAADFRMRWGQNEVAQILSAGQTGPQIGPLLASTFDESEGLNEAQLSHGDSGGGVFIQSGTTWKLAGINYGSDSQFNTQNAGPGFSAAIFDAGGLYSGGEGNWTYRADTVLNIPAPSYATRISAHISWIESILASALEPPILQTADDPTGTFSDLFSATVDSSAKTIRVPPSGAARYYRLRSCTSTRIRTIQVESGTVLLTYD